VLTQAATDGASVERFGTLLALLSRMRRVVVVVDDLEAVHGNPAGARQIAGFLATTRQEAPFADIVVSVNDDVWESAFVPALSGGLLDRLSEVVITLGSLTGGEILSLLASRGHGDPRELARQLPLRTEDRHARRVLRLASEVAPTLASRAPSPGDEPGD
jgi:hypothetical protein